MGCKEMKDKRKEPLIKQEDKEKDSKENKPEGSTYIQTLNYAEETIPLYRSSGKCTVALCKSDVYFKYMFYQITKEGI